MVCWQRKRFLIHHGEEIVLIIWPIKIRLLESLQETDKKRGRQKKQLSRGRVCVCEGAPGHFLWWVCLAKSSKQSA